MAWTGVITNSGAVLLDQWALGGTLTITGAATGTGTVAEAALMAQTALVSQKQEASIVAREKLAEGVKVKLQISAPETGYTLQQYGVWAKLDDGEAILLAIFQKPEGVVIPSAAETPDFVYTLWALLTVSNEGELEVTVDPSALVTYGTMEEYVATATADMAAHLDRRDNPHGVTPAQLGLGEVLEAEALGPTGRVSFQADHSGLPLKSCVVNIEPAQAGSGDPSPSNIRPIPGWTGSKVYATGKNLLPPMGTEDILVDGVQWTVNGDGTFYSQGIEGDTRSQPYQKDIKLAPGDYWLSGCPAGSTPDILYLRVLFYTGDTITSSYTDAGSGAAFTVTGNETRIMVFAHHRATNTSKVLWKPQIEAGSSATAYESFGNEISVDWNSQAGTVCSGTLDVLKGLLTATASAVELQTATVAKLSGAAGYEHHFVLTTSIPDYIAAVDSTVACSHYKAVSTTSAAYVGDYQIWPRILNDVMTLVIVDPRYTTVSEMQTFLNTQKSAGTPVTVRYPVNETTCQLTPQMISTLLGQNNIWADCGDVTVEYGAFLQALQGETEILARYLEDRSRAAKSILAGVEETSTATANYAVGDFVIVGDNLYKVTAAIASGETIAVGTNVQETTVAQQLKALFASV